MLKLSSHRLDELNRGLPGLYRVKSPREVKEAVLALIDSLISVEVATVDELQPDGSVTLTTYPETEVLKTESVRSALATHLSEHPGIPAFVSGAPVPVLVCDHFRSGKYFKTGLFNEVYRPVGVRYQMNTMPPGDLLRNFVLTMHRKEKDFSEEDRTVMSLLAPHFSQAYQNALAWSEAEQKRELILKATTSLANEIIPLKKCGRPETLSKRAIDWFAFYFPEESNRSSFPSSIAVWLRTVRDSGALTSASVLRVSRDGRELQLHWFSGADAHELLLVRERRSMLDPDRLKKLGLTARETEVFRWMVEGKSDAEIGLILSISPHTAHKHVQHILSKLDISNRATALLRVSELIGEM